MRDIRFRGIPIKEVKKDLGRKFAIGSFIRQPAFDKKDCGYIIGDSETNEMIPVDKKTVGQFTGLYDKNNKPIYEGDIINIPENWDDYGVSAGEIYQIYFAFGGFRLKPKYKKSSKGFWLEDTKELEIIGNINENPELIKQ